MLALLVWAGATPALAETVRLRFDAANPQARYAAQRLGESLREQRHEIAGKGKSSDFVIVLTHGGPLNDAYYNPLPKNYKISWMRSMT